MGFCDRGLLIEPILSEVYDWHFENIQSEGGNDAFSIDRQESAWGLYVGGGRDGWRIRRDNYGRLDDAESYYYVWTHSCGGRS
jgi:hypothetical protein